MDIWVVARFGLLWITTALSILVDIFLWPHVCIIWDNSGVELLNLMHMYLCICSAWSDTVKQFSKVKIFKIYSHTCSIWEFWLLCILTNTWLYLFFSFLPICVEVFHCGFNFHFPDELEKIFINLLAVWILSLVKCLFKAFAHFSSGLPIYFLNIFSILYIFWI